MKTNGDSFSSKANFTDDFFMFYNVKTNMADILFYVYLKVEFLFIIDEEFGFILYKALRIYYTYLKKNTCFIVMY